MFIQFLSKTAACCLLLVTIGCGSNWRTHEAQQLVPRPMFDNSAPEWVQGISPQSDGRIYFVGRSRTPDSPFETSAKNWRWKDEPTPNTRTGYTVMDERDAVQSAREDIFDQIRQRLAPRNMGNASNLMVDNIDSGTCISCGSVEVFRTEAIVCNDTCSHGAGNCNDAHIKIVTVGGKKGCQSCHKPVSQCAGCSTIVHAVTQLNRTPDYISSGLRPLSRDLNIANINVDLMMPSLAAYLSEEEVYFEKWHVHDGHDHNSRPFANGRDEWQSYKCWMLCSIPAEEFYSIAEDFREKYQELYELAVERADQNRTRRIQDEDANRALTITRQEEERDWNRKDEEVTRQHTIGIDKDRHELPGRRFTLESE
jgi:hypothetical protein